MKILEVVEACGAGVGRHVIGLCCGLVASNHQVTVAYSPHRLDSAFERFMVQHRGEIRFFPLEARREVSPVADMQNVIRLLRLIEREGPFDVIHGHSSKAGGLARIAGRIAGLPTVYTPNSLIMSSPEIPRYKAAAYGLIERSLGHLATSKMVAVSEEEREFMLELKLAPDWRIALIENNLEDGVFENYSRTPSIESLAQRPLTFGATIRFSPQKAPSTLIESFLRVDENLSHIPMRLVIAGDGELFQGIKEQVEASGAENIILLGWQPDTQDLLREFDVFLISSLYEGFPYTVLEAMAAKLPVVSTSVFGTRQTIAQVPGNVLVPPGDPDAFARGMQQIVAISGPESIRSSLRQIGQANHNYARTRFIQSRALERIVELYSELGA